MPKSKKKLLNILYIPDAKLETWFDYSENCPVTLQFKNEEEAYKYLLAEHLTNYVSRERSLQILLLVSELSKTDSEIAYKIFLDDKKQPKTINHITLFAYFNKHKMFKQAFKAYCDVVVVMGLGDSRQHRKACFEHFEIVEEE